MPGCINEGVKKVFFPDLTRGKSFGDIDGWGLIFLAVTHLIVRGLPKNIFFLRKYLSGSHIYRVLSAEKFSADISTFRELSNARG